MVQVWILLLSPLTWKNYFDVEIIQCKRANDKQTFINGSFYYWWDGWNQCQKRTTLINDSIQNTKAELCPCYLGMSPYMSISESGFRLSFFLIRWAKEPGFWPWAESKKNAKREGKQVRSRSLWGCNLGQILNLVHFRIA